ncbi:MAG: glycoside hydrolase family 32 protein [Chitinophagaceae bacterium]|nr:glycoside hydrolase family 32 protein [Chitinophagaceae bacterium]
MPLAKWTFTGGLVLTMLYAGAQSSVTAYKEVFRPQLHFSPREKWTNDPNGLVYYQGVYHLFFQHFPGDIIWGPMHWGHAVSNDLIHWRQQPIALYPDSLGYIFSGSVVVDSGNTSGFGKRGQVPMVAIFTHHDPAGEKKGTIDYQSQSLAYSLDRGRTWIKYKNNPVLKNPGIVDFRDPNVMWYKPDKKWVMTLATKDRVTFYSSVDLKNWTKESEFGKGQGAHDGVWECPNLFPMQMGDTVYWVLLVSTNPGGPNGGSGTQYFIGQFDGKKFYTGGSTVKWIDYGPDDYAGITWNNTGRRKIFLGWMSNWIYANQVPTTAWRNAMTLPRELKLAHAGEDTYLSSLPVKELTGLSGKPVVINKMQVDTLTDLSGRLPATGPQYRLEVHADSLKDFFISCSNVQGQQMILGYEKASNRWYIDRALSGKTDFNKEFPKKIFAPRVAVTPALDLTLVMDVSSLEVFADKGLTVMTAIFFPDSPLTRLRIGSKEPWEIRGLTFTPLRSIW